MLAFVGVGARAANAAWLPEGTPVLATGHTEVLHSASTDGAGGAYILYGSKFLGTPLELRLLRISAAGAPTPGWGPAGRLITEVQYEENLRGVAMTRAPGGGMYVAWTEGSSDSPDTLRAIRLDAEGFADPEWPARGVVVHAGVRKPPPDNEVSISVSGAVSDDTGMLYVAETVSWRNCWSEGPCEYGDGMSVFRISAQGVVLGSQPLGLCSHRPAAGGIITDGAGGLITCSNGGCGLSQWWPAGATDATWQPSQATGYELSLIRAAPDAPWIIGRPANPGGPLQVQRTSLDLTPLEGWENGRSLPVDDFPRRLNIGWCESSELQLNVEPDGAGGVLFAWHAPPWNTRPIRALRLSPSGAPMPGWDPAGTLVTAAPALPHALATAPDGLGGMFLAWLDTRDASTTGTDVYAAHVLGDGSLDPAFPAAGRVLCVASPEHFVVHMTPADSGAAIVFWEDYRNGNADIYAQRLPLDVATAAEVSLAWARPIAGGASLAWRVSGGVTAVRLQRSIAPGEWREIATLFPDGVGEVAFEDRALSPGSRAGYRLMLADGTVAGETWVTVPGRALALAGFCPNPGGAGVDLVFTLGSDAPATVEVLDVAGRRVFARDIAGHGAGEHRIALTAPLAPGIYVIRLAQGDAVRTTRGAVVR